MQHLALEITEEQRANLKTLATYLTSGNLLAEFDMSDYTQEFETHTERIEATTCGTVGCAAGHGPYAGIPKSIFEDWGAYTARVFGLGISVGLDFTDALSHHFCFSAGWSHRDNTPDGAGRRILYALERGIPVTACNDIDFRIKY